MLRAIEEIKKNNLSIGKAATLYNIPKSTLERHVNKKIRNSGTTDLGNFKPALTSSLENQLVEHAKKLQDMFFGLTPESLRELAFDIAKANHINVPFRNANHKAGKDWLAGFLKRHPELSIRQPEATSFNRAIGFNRTQVKRFFDLLKSILQKETITSNMIYNVDETGITCVQKPSKVIAKKGTKQVGRITSAERGKTVTAVSSMNAIGNYIPPIFVFPRKRMYPALLKGAPQGSKGYTSKSGWIDSNIFLQWLFHFKEHACPRVDKKALLILDNHSSHLSLDAINFAKENHIIMLSIPPHTSHKLQPLDKTFFGPLKTFYNREIDKWLISNPGKRVSNWELCELFCHAYEQVATVQKALNGFRCAGIVPFNPDIFGDEDFSPSTVTELEMPLTNDGIGTLYSFSVNEVDSGRSESIQSTANAAEINLESIFSANCESNEDFSQSIITKMPISQTSDESYFEGLLNILADHASTSKTKESLPWTSNATSENSKSFPEMLIPQTSNDDNIFEDVLTFSADRASTSTIAEALQSTTNTTRENLKSTSAVASYQNNTHVEVNVIDISPLPRGKIKSRKRKGKQSELLTSSPYQKKISIENHFKSSKKEQCNVGLEHKHKCSKSKRHQPRFFEEYQCIVCGELNEDPPKEDWIQCHKCEDWSHENCTDYRGNGFYKCDLCTKFVSD